MSWLKYCLASLMVSLIGRRPPAAAELEVLKQLWDEQRQAFAAEPDAARQFLAIGDHPRDEKLDATELAALAVVAEAIMNFDETVTKR